MERGKRWYSNLLKCNKDQLKYETLAERKKPGLTALLHNQRPPQNPLINYLHKIHPCREAFSVEDGFGIGDLVTFKYHHSFGIQDADCVMLREWSGVLNEHLVAEWVGIDR